MIASLRGRVVDLRLDAVVVEVGGVGLLAHATPGTLAGLRLGGEAHLATSLVVREDALTLYAFADADERDVFEAVQTVSGIGPRLALAMLAVHTPDALRRAVATEDLAALQRVPGIGRKGAQRMILELREKLGALHPDGVPGGAAAGDGALDARGEVREALAALGYAAPEIARTLDALPADEDATAEELLRSALRALGTR